MRQEKILAMLAVLLWTNATAAVFESPPGEPAAASLAAEFVSGPDFHITEPVASDGLMHHYVIDSRFGIFPAYGQGELKVRLREVAALTQLSKTTDVDVITKTVARHVQGDAKTLGQAVANPIGTVAGIPKGIGHLFNGYKAQAKELSERAAPQAGAKSNSSVAQSAKANATRYADRYLGVSAAERRSYQQLGVDPYTNNAALRKAVHHLAKVEATTSLGLHFVGLPGVPYLGDIRRAMDAIYNEDPAVLRARRRATLAGYGLDAEEIDRFENTILLSPTRQEFLEQVAKSLDGVAGRDELFRHAMSVTTEEEVEVFLQSAGLLSRLHARRPLTRIVAGLRLPTGQFSDGRLVVLGSFDCVYWTDDVAVYESTLRASLPPAANGLELWLSGSVSPLARSELITRGWEVHDNAAEALMDSPGPPATSIMGADPVGTRLKVGQNRVRPLPVA